MSPNTVITSSTFLRITFMTPRLARDCLPYPATHALGVIDSRNHIRLAFWSEIPATTGDLCKGTTPGNRDKNRVVPARILWEAFRCLC